MTGIQVPNLSSPVIQPRPSSLNLGQILPLVLQQLQQSRENRMEEAKNAVSNVAEGQTFGSLTPEQQAAYQRLTGRKNIGADEVFKPETGAMAAFARVAAPGSMLHSTLVATYARQMATGQASPPTTAEGIAAETSANVARARAGAVESGNLETAVGKVNAGHAADLNDAELVAYQAAHSFIPSTVLSDNMSATMRMAVMQEGMRVLRDPNNAGFSELLAQYGTHRDTTQGSPTFGRQVPNVTLANLIGAVAMGVGTQIDQAMGLRNIQINNAGQARNTILEADARQATTFNQAAGGRFQTAEIIAVMHGDPQASSTPRGRAIQSLMNAGYNAAMLDAATKGNPAAQAWQRVMELSKNPQLASDPRTLRTVLQAANEVYTTTVMDATQGPRPADPPLGTPATEARATRERQRAWDTVHAGLVNSMAFFTIEGNMVAGRRIVANAPPDATAAQAAQAARAQAPAIPSMEVVDQIIQATVPGATRVGQGMRQVPAGQPVPQGRVHQQGPTP